LAIESAAEQPIIPVVFSVPGRKPFSCPPPCIIGASSEGGTDLFSVKYFEQDAYLAQSPQLYKQMIACSMEKATMITPVWRAEKHNTTRHINEIRQMDIDLRMKRLYPPPRRRF